MALYGATSGKAFINGVAGERFCVRNSGATAVVEGVGEHCCEYMTGGCVLILGPTGRNFAAGMSGGTAYVFDEDYRLYLHVNKAFIDVAPVNEPHDVAAIRSLLEEHYAATHSPQAQRILSHFAEMIGFFKKIIPREQRLINEEIAAAELAGQTREEAALTAFLKRRSSL